MTKRMMEQLKGFTNPAHGVFEFRGSRREVRTAAKEIEAISDEVGFRNECCNSNWFCDVGGSIFRSDDNGDGSFTITNIERMF